MSSDNLLSVLFSPDGWVNYCHYRTPSFLSQLEIEKSVRKTKPFTNDKVSKPPKPSAKKAPAPAPVKKEKRKVNEIPIRFRPRLLMKFSTLSRSEHIRYFELKHKETLTKLNEDEKTELQFIKDRIQKEQEDYRIFQQQNVAQCNICQLQNDGDLEVTAHPHNHHGYLHPSIETTMKSLIAAKRARGRLYPQFYEIKDSIDLSDTSENTNITLHYERHLGAKGSIPKFDLPQTNPWHYLDPSLCPFYFKYPVQSYKCVKSLQYPVISKDKICLDYMTKENCDIAMSSSSLLELATLCVDWNTELLMPVTVNKSDNGNIRVLLDKPLVHQQYTGRRINEMYYKAALISDMINIQSEEENTKTETSKSEMSYMSYDTLIMDNCKILIRSKRHGEFDYNASNQICIVRSKMEYNNKGFDIEMDGSRNLEFESITDQEYLEYYFKLLLLSNSPNSRLLVGRINCFNSSLIRMDQFTFESLSSYLAALSFSKPKHSVSVINKILSQLPKLSPGQYLLKHAPGEKSITILSTTDTNNKHSFDLHETCSLGGRVDLETSTYIPNSNELTSVTKVPNTFPLHSPLFERGLQNRSMQTGDMQINVSQFFIVQPPKTVKPIKKETLNVMAAAKNWGSKPVIEKKDTQGKEDSINTQTQKNYEIPSPAKLFVDSDEDLSDESGEVSSLASGRMYSDGD